MGKAIAILVALAAVGWLASSFLGPLLYFLVVGGGAYIYSRVKRSLAPGTRTQRRIEAAARTYRMRNR
jgi:hypothetical protein